VTWVHPSWRDLVIGALAADAAERRRFLARCGVDGAALALSTGGGAAGERERPLLGDDADWDALADGLHRLCADVEDADAVRLLSVLADAEPDPEVSALAALVARRLARRWQGRALSVDALAAWAAVAAKLPERPEPPSPAATWIELEPDSAPATPVELERFADWVRLAEVLAVHDPELLAGLGFPRRYGPALAQFVHAAPHDEPPLEHELRLQALERLARIDAARAARALETLAALSADDRAPAFVPADEPVPPPRSRFPVERVLQDLVE
jgi:hypothetical protein